MDWTNKEESIKNAKFRVGNTFSGLHPVDKVEAYREIETFAGKEAKKQETLNQEQGVPERAKEQAS